MHQLQTLDYTAIVVYMALMATIGLLLGGLVKDVGAYFKAGGTLPWVAAAISNYMSMFSAFIFVAYAGIAYQDGLVAITVVWCTVPPALLGAAVFGPRWRRAGIMTPVEYLETRFNAPVRQFFSWGGIGFGVLNNMVRLYAIGIFISGATPLSLELSILVAGVIVVLYTFLGGLWAVVLTDTVQFVVLIFTTMILLPLALDKVGGLGGLRQALPDHFSFFHGPKGAPLYLLAYYTMISIKYNGNWSFIQRFYSVRDEAAGRKMGLLMAGLFFVFPFFFLLPAMAARVVVPDLAQPETAYAAIALRLLPPGIMGLMMAAMFAATMSAVDSELNVTASVFVRDVYERHLRPAASPGELMWVARGTTLVVGGLIVAGAMFASLIGGAFEANKLLTALIGIPLAIPLVMGIVLRPPRPWGAVAAVLVGVAAGAVLNLHPEVSWSAATLIVIGLSVATLVVSGLVPSRDPRYRQRVEALFARLSTPVPDDDKPVPDPAFRRSLLLLLAVALTAAGTLFIAMSLPSIVTLSGVLALAAGLVCCLLAVLIFCVARGSAETPAHPLS